MLCLLASACAVATPTRPAPAITASKNFPGRSAIMFCFFLRFYVVTLLFHLRPWYVSLLNLCKQPHVG